MTRFGASVQEVPNSRGRSGIRGASQTANRLAIDIRPPRFGTVAKGVNESFRFSAGDFRIGCLDIFDRRNEPAKSRELDGFIDTPDRSVVEARRMRRDSSLSRVLCRHAP